MAAKKPADTLNPLRPRDLGVEIPGPYGPGQSIPRFTIDLSCPPAKRYVHIVPQLKKQIRRANLSTLFSELLRKAVPSWIAGGIRLSARRSLKKLWSEEETAEIRGISEATGIDMFLLVAFNVVLDAMMGCTSGAALAHENGTERMMHFRTLDWEMDSLRHLVIHLDFVRKPRGPVVASSVTYFGYVGVLTGVRRGLSLSLNFRPRHDAPSNQFRWHQLRVLLGKRQSISSMLRDILLKPDEYLDNGDDTDERGMVRYLRKKFPKKMSTAALLTFTTPKIVYIMEKDFVTARTIGSTVFGSAFNHDVRDEEDEAILKIIKKRNFEESNRFDSVIATSVLRKVRLDEVWKLCSGPCFCNNCGQQGDCTHPPDRRVDHHGLQRMLNDPFITNYLTHFAVIMDPRRGTVSWERVYLPPSSNGKPKRSHSKT